MYLGLILFILAFTLIAPSSQAFLLGSLAGVGDWIVRWAPLSYLLLLIMLAAPFAGVHLIRNWPARVEEENPMAKYRREAPLEED